MQSDPIEEQEQDEYKEWLHDYPQTEPDEPDEAPATNAVLSATHDPRGDLEPAGAVHPAGRLAPSSRSLSGPCDVLQWHARDSRRHSLIFKQDFEPSEARHPYVESTAATIVKASPVQERYGSNGIQWPNATAGPAGRPEMPVPSFFEEQGDPQHMLSSPQFETVEHQANFMLKDMLRNLHRATDVLVQSRSVLQVLRKVQIQVQAFSADLSSALDL